MLTNKDFLAILKKACKSENMDKYLNKRLGTCFPYDLTFGKGDEY